MRPNHALSLLCVLSAIACSASAGCGAPEAAEDVESLEESIVGGRATKTSHPAVGYLAGRDDEAPFCTATLVEPRFVVTAAHCIRGERATSLVFGTGAFDLAGKRASIARCRANSKFRMNADSTAPFDFAFCELAAPLSGIRPLAFVSSPSKSARLLAIGYGQTDADDEDSAGPRKQLAVHRVDDDDPLLEGIVDMLGVRSAAGDTCMGDSGSPLLVLAANGTARVAGVLNGGVSTNDSDCTGGNVSLYAPIAMNLAFFATR